MRQNKQTDFDERLKQRQRDFTSELQPERPADINFSEEKDQPLNDDMNAMIQQLRSKRELDIHTIGEKQKEQQNKDHPKLIITETTVDDSVNTVDDSANDAVNTVNDSVNTVDIDNIKKKKTLSWFDDTNKKVANRQVLISDILVDLLKVKTAINNLENKIKTLSMD